MKKLFCILAALCIVPALCVPSLALSEYRLTGTEWSIALPPQMYVLSKDMSADDPVLEIFGDSYDEVQAYLDEWDYCLDAYNEFFDYEISVSVYKEDCMNYCELSEAELQDELDYNSSVIADSGQLASFSDYTLSGNGFNFLCFEYVIDESDMSIPTILCFTELGSEALYFRCYTFGRDFTQEERDAFFDAILSLSDSSLSVIPPSEKPNTAVNITPVDEDLSDTDLSASQTGGGVSINITDPDFQDLAAASAPLTSSAVFLAVMAAAMLLPACLFRYGIVRRRISTKKALSFAVSYSVILIGILVSAMRPAGLEQLIFILAIIFTFANFLILSFGPDFKKDDTETYRAASGKYTPDVESMPVAGRAPTFSDFLAVNAKKIRTSPKTSGDPEYRSAFSSRSRGGRCSRCGAKLEPGVGFCERCGETVPYGKARD